MHDQDKESDNVIAQNKDKQNWKNQRNHAIKNLELKYNSVRDGKCLMCWHPKINCICQLLPRINFSENIRLLVYIDYKEMYNAGDDGKLLSIACPTQTKRYVYSIDDDDLVADLRSLSRDDIVVLFPSEIALSYNDYKLSREVKREREGQGDNTSSLLTIIVVDGVWRHARRMAHRLRELLPGVTHVQLTPEQLSIYARTQTQPDRICTVEATALFLSHCGESVESTNSLIECVRINNIALRHGISNHLKDDQRPLYSRDAKHPAWYFGDYYLYKKDLLASYSTAREKKNVLSVDL